jgi:hypothetical protein
MAGHRDLYHKIAALPHEPPQAAAFGPHHQRDRQRQVHLIVACRRVPCQADRPDPELLQFLDGAGDVDDVGNLHVRGGAGGGLAGGPAKRRRSSSLSNHAMRTGSVDAAENRAEVLRIFHPVEHDQERGRDRLAHQVGQVVGSRRFEIGDYALMRASGRHPVQVVIAHTSHRHATLGSQRNDLTDPLVVASADTNRSDAIGS